MPKCIHCDFDNSPGLGFCQNCGHKIKEVQAGTFNFPPPPTTESQQGFASSGATDHYTITKKKGLNPWIVVVPLALAAVFFMGRYLKRMLLGGYNNEYRTENNYYPKKDTTSYTGQTNIADSIAYPAEGNSQPSTAYPEKEVSTEATSETMVTEYALTQTELANISSLLQKYFQNENQEDIGGMAASFTFPIKRYFNKFAVERSSFDEEFKDHFADVPYHVAQVDFENSSVEKTLEKYYVKAAVNYHLGNSSDDAQKYQLLHIMWVTADNKIEDIYIPADKK